MKLELQQNILLLESTIKVLQVQLQTDVLRLDEEIARIDGLVADLSNNVEELKNPFAPMATHDDKDIANQRGEPYMSCELRQQPDGTISVTTDFNDTMISGLRDLGYDGTDQEIIDQYVKSVYLSVSEGELI